MVTLIADITAVNGNPEKGSYVGRTRAILSSPTPANGGAIADITRIAMREHFFEILTAGGTKIGTIMSTGFSGGTAPPRGGGRPARKGTGRLWEAQGAYSGARGRVGATGGAARGHPWRKTPARGGPSAEDRTGFCYT